MNRYLYASGVYVKPIYSINPGDMMTYIIKESIEMGRKDKVEVFVREADDNDLDDNDLLDAAIGIKWTEGGNQYGEVVGFRRHDINQSNIDKAIQFLININSSTIVPRSHIILSSINKRPIMIGDLP